MTFKRDFQRVLELLVCPDCHGELSHSSGAVHCIGCGKEFQVFGGAGIEILPSEKVHRTGTSFVAKRSIEVYERLFEEAIGPNTNPAPWGLVYPQSYERKLAKHKYLVDKLIPESISNFCDISAGSGRFSWDVAKRFELAVLCDLSVDSVIYLTQKATQERVNNVFVLRCDYLRPPFREGVFDVVQCNDTLIYGPGHEMGLLRSMNNALRRGGHAIVDIAYKYHRAFWHKPYTYGYSRREMMQMLYETGFEVKRLVPLYHELSGDLEELKTRSKILRAVLPPTRYIFDVIK